MSIKCVFSVISTIGLSISTLSVSAMSGPAAIAQNSTATHATQTSAARIGFVPPADEGAPRYTRGGATRDNCNALQVLPETGSGWTAQARPTIVAYFKKDVEQVLLKVDAVDGSESYIYADDEFFMIEGEGLAEIPMPDSLSELTPGKQYGWTMLLMCRGKAMGPNSTFVEGGIQRVSSVLSAEEAEAVSWNDKASVYAESGLWYDLISTLMLAKAEMPENSQVEQVWDSVWTSVGLDVAFEEFISEEWVTDIQGEL